MSSPDLKVLEAYFRLMNTNGAAQVYRAALNAGVYDALQTGVRSAAEVAEACGTQERPTALLLEALAAIGVVERDDLGFKLADVTRMLLMSEYRELGDPYWRHLPAYLQTGDPIKKMDDPARSEEYYQAQVASLGWMLAPAAEAAATALDIGRERRNLSVLDVGAGSGIWSLTIAQRDPGALVTAIDWPAILEVTRETAANMGVAERLTTLAGNYHEVALPENAFDLALVANVSHLETVQGNQALFRRLHRSLRAGGELVIIDALPGNPQGATPFALYQLGLALRTEHGRVYAAEELEAMLDADRFDKPRLVPLDVPPHMVGMLIARKRP